MQSDRSQARNTRTVLGRAVVLLAAAVLLFSSASAQSLSHVLPQDTFAVIGVTGISEHKGKFQPFIDEWERLGLTELFSQAFEDYAGEDLEGEVEAFLPSELEGLTLYDFLGDEAWVAVSASRSNPLPAFTLIARVSDDAAAGIKRLWDSEAVERQVLTEGNIQFSIDEVGDEPLAVAIDGNFFALSSNPDVMRGLLRRYQGASEPNFRDSQGYESISQLAPANVVFYFDLPRVVDLAQPFAAGMGFDASVVRLANALRTFGTYTSVTRITHAGLVSESHHVLGDPSLDPALYSLLTTNIPVSNSATTFIDGSAVSYQAVGMDAAGGWNYLSNLVNDLSELGIGNLDNFLSMELGIDLNRLLFSWIGTTFAVVSPYSEVAEIGMAPENMLGDTLYLVETTNPAAAEEGLNELINMVAMFASMFMDPFGDGSAGPAEPAQRTVAGVTVTSYDMGQGLVFELAVTNGYAVVATSSGAMNAALTASAQGGAMPATLASLAGNVPGNSSTVLLQDGAASLRMMGQILTSQFGLYAGLISTDLDFDAAEAASEALGQYIEFLASKSGGQYSYSSVQGGVTTGYSLTTVHW